MSAEADIAMVCEMHVTAVACKDHCTHYVSWNMHASKLLSVTPNIFLTVFPVVGVLPFRLLGLESYLVKVTVLLKLGACRCGIINSYDTMP